MLLHSAALLLQSAHFFGTYKPSATASPGHSNTPTHPPQGKASTELNKSQSGNENKRVGPLKCSMNNKSKIHVIKNY